MANHPDLAPIESSMFSAHHYDPDSRIMTLQFKNGAVHQYEDVPAEKNDAFLGNESKGRYFSAKIKPNHLGRKVSE